MKIRKAEAKDLPFIIEAIIESEKSGGDIFPYSAALGVSISRFSQILMDVFDEEINDQPWCLEHWYIAESPDGSAAAGLSSWEEGKGGISSDMLKAQTLNYFLKNEWQDSQDNLKVLSSVTIARKTQYMQLEHLYTHPSHRGKGYMKNLINGVINTFRKSNFEIQVLESNKNAVSLYEYIGFSVNERQCNEDIERLSLLSGSCKLQLLKNHG